MATVNAAGSPAGASSNAVVPSSPTKLVQVTLPEEEPEPAKRCFLFVPLDPRTNPFVAYWDLVAMIALIFTALVTPYEVAFLIPPPMEERLTDPLFLINRVVDLIFVVDMLLQFRTVYKTEDVRTGTRWVS